MENWYCILPWFLFAGALAGATVMFTYWADAETRLHDLEVERRRVLDEQRENGRAER